MGFKEGSILLESDNGCFNSGETVRGKLIFQLNRVKTCLAIYIKITGVCRVSWTTTDIDNNIRFHTSKEEYVNMRVYLLGGRTGEQTLVPGHHTYPFSFQLPPDCPSSYEGAYGHIRYKCKAVVERALMFDQKKKIGFRVIAPLNLNLVPEAKNPINIAISKSYSCFCISTGSTVTFVRAPVSGCCPGQTFPLHVTCINKGSVEINHIALRVTKKTTFITSDRRRSKKETIAELGTGFIPGKTTREWKMQMIIPAMDVDNLTKCKHIIIDYKLKVKVYPSGCYNKSKESCKLIFGTIPIQEK